MQVDSWSKDDLLSEFGRCENLRELILQVENHYSEKNQLVCEIQVNGMTLEEEDEIRFAETTLQEIKEFSVKTGPLSELIGDVAQAFSECIPSVQDTAVHTAECFRSADHKKAHASFAAVLEGCQWLVDTLVYARQASLKEASPFSACFVDDRWGAAEKSFSRMLRQIMVAFEKKDFVLLADLLEYELTTILEEWSGLIQQSSQEAHFESKESLTAAGQVSSKGERNSEENGGLNRDPAETSAEDRIMQDSLGGR